MTSLYDDSAARTYRYDAAAGADKMSPPPIIGRTNLRPSLTSFTNIMLMGKVPSEIKNYVSTYQEAAAYWQTNMVQLKGNDLTAQAIGGKINVLPSGYSQFINYEDSTPERRRCFPTSTTKTVVSTNYLTFVTSADDIYLFRKETVIKNWKNSESKHAIVTDVNFTTNVVTIKALYGETAFTAVTDFFVSDSSTTDELEILGTSVDLFNPASKASDLSLRPFRGIESANIKVYNTQLFEKVYGTKKFHDNDYKAFPGARPRANRTASDATYEMFENLESAFLWNKASDNGSSGRTFNGLYNSIVTNTSTINGGALSIDDIDLALVDQLGGTHSSNALYGLCSFKTMQIVEQLFAGLQASGHCRITPVQSGVYQAPVNVIQYRGKEIYLMPIANMSIPTMANRQFGNPASANAYATKLMLVDPAALCPVVGSHTEKGALFFDIEENVQTPEQTFYETKNVIRNYMGFALLHESTSAIINGITSADLQG